MFYYKVIPASSKFSAKEPLIYCCEKDLPIGQVVAIAFRNYACNGVIIERAAKPPFTANPVSEVFQGVILPPPSVGLLEWMRGYYPGPLGQTVQLFLPPKVNPAEGPTAPEKAKLNTKLPPLTTEQKNVLDTMSSSKDRAFLLHGAAGSGKTRVYIELAKQCADSGKSAIVLTPEISLTPQLVKAFRQVFGSKVLLTHSGLKASERSRVWQACLSKDDPWIVLGPRSAVFAPAKNVGLIVIDEAHDSSYKQDKTPFYHTLRVAGFLASSSKARLVMGTATPTISEYWLAKKRQIPILKMAGPAIKTSYDVKTSVVDMTDKDNLGKFPLLSKPLVSELSKALSDNVQSMVFINKRGDSRSIICQNCGWQAKCSSCDLPLTFHSDEGRFSCHTCGRQYPSRTDCENCGSADIIFKSPGTKAIASYLAKLFPSAKIARFDTDNKKPERIDARHGEIAAGNIDILVGTQLLTKGHDLPNLGLAAMLLAESGLSFPDYTAEERAFQTIRQLAGRVGRGHRAGHVIIQSFNPDSALLSQALNSNYEAFYESQIKERQAYGFPPLWFVLKISSPRASSASSLRSAQKIREQIESSHPDCVVLGPSPAFYFKKAGKYNWQLIVKAKQRTVLTSIIDDLPAGHSANIDPSNLL